MIIKLQTAAAVAQINSIGAELISYQDVFGVEYMWQKDAKYWNRCSPLLFPIVGNLKDNKTIIDGKEYSIPKHGFCRDAEFKVVFKSDTKAIFNYQYNEDTLAVYPYKFSITLTYMLSDTSLEIGYSVLNMDNKGIDYCIGAHPAFNVPIGEGTFEDYCLEFNQYEPDGCAVYDLEKLEIDVDNRINRMDENNKMQLKYSYFDQDAMIFDKAKSDSVKLYSIKTGRGVQVDFGGFDSIAFWTPTKMDAPFLCIEPWNGMAARSDEDEQFTSKLGIRHLMVDEQHSYKLLITQL